MIISCLDKQQSKLKLSPKKAVLFNDENKLKQLEPKPSEPVISHYFAKPSSTGSESMQMPNRTTSQTPIPPISVSLKTTTTSTMDKKRSFFARNFGCANKSENIEENYKSFVGTASTKINKSHVAKPVINKKKSFFAAMKENNLPLCKIESAFDNLSNKENSNCDGK